VVNHWTGKFSGWIFKIAMAFLIPCKVQIFSVYNDIRRLARICYGRHLGRDLASG